MEIFFQHLDEWNQLLLAVNSVFLIQIKHLINNQCQLFSLPFYKTLEFIEMVDLNDSTN